MKNKTLIALIVIAAGFALALTPAIKNFEPYTVKAYAPPTTKPLTQTPTQPQTIQHYDDQTPLQETCQTDQNVTLGQLAYLCRRFDSNYNIETGSLTVNTDGHEFRFELIDHQLFDDQILVSCYADGELQKTEQPMEEGAVLECETDGVRVKFFYNEYIEGNKTQCHGDCDSHEDEVDNSKMRTAIGGIGRLDDEETTTIQKPLQQITQTIQHYDDQTPLQETCQTDQNVTLGQRAYLCRRFDSNYNIETGSLTTTVYDHEFRFELIDHQLFDDQILVSCYADGELQKSEQPLNEYGALDCGIDGVNVRFYYHEYIEGNKTQCHGDCDSHEDEVDNSKMRTAIGGIGRLDDEETTTIQKPLQQTTQTIQHYEEDQSPVYDNCQGEHDANTSDLVNLCRRFDDNYNIETGSVTVEYDGKEYTFKLVDHELFEEEIIASCYIDGELQVYRQTMNEEGAVLTCQADGDSSGIDFIYDEYVEGTKAHCHGDCDSHEDEVDDTERRIHIGAFGRAPQPIESTIQAIQKIFKKFIPWLHN